MKHRRIPTARWMPSDISLETTKFFWPRLNIQRWWCRGRNSLEVIKLSQPCDWLPSGWLSQITIVSVCSATLYLLDLITESDTRWGRACLIAAVLFNNDKGFFSSAFLFSYSPSTLPQGVRCQLEHQAAAAQCVGTTSYAFRSSNLPTGETGPDQITWCVCVFTVWIC